MYSLAPGVDTAVDSDLAHLKIVLKASGLIKIRKQALDEVFKEVKTRLHEELDYCNEADNVRRFRELHRVHPFVVIPDVVGERSSQRINAMVGDLVLTTLARDDGQLHLSAAMDETITELRAFLYDNVYRNYRVHAEFEKAQRIIRDLYAFFLEHEFPASGLASCCRLREPPATGADERRRHRRVCDFIAGMTDRYALTLYTHIFMPKPWSVL